MYEYFWLGSVYIYIHTQININRVLIVRIYNWIKIFGTYSKISSCSEIFLFTPWQD